MSASFWEKVSAARADSGSDILLNIRPSVMRLPLPIRRYDDPFLPFGRAVIKATSAVVCGYVFDFAAYLSIGAAGAVALERTLNALPDNRLAILDGRFAGSAYADVADEIAFVSDGLTLASADHLADYLRRADRCPLVYGEPTLADSLPPSAGVFCPPQVIINRIDGAAYRLRIAGDDVLYCASGDDFADHIRAALVAMNRGEDA